MLLRVTSRPTMSFTTWRGEPCPWQQWIPSKTFLYKYKQRLDGEVNFVVSGVDGIYMSLCFPKALLRHGKFENDYTRFPLWIVC